MKLSKVVAAAAVIAVLGYGGFRAFGPPPMFGKALSPEEKQACGITAEVTEGPYYVSGTSELTNGNLNYANLPGMPLTISGHVYQGLGNDKPVVGAIVEIWHADSIGSYHPNGNGPASNYQPSDIALRGFVKTDSAGAYRFTTVYPGEYGGRTRHIHIKVRDGEKELTTQLIIPAQPGDEITFDEDTVSRGLPNCHLLKIDTATTPASASFDFRL